MSFLLNNSSLSAIFRVVDVHGDEVNFKIKMNTTMAKMKKSYAERKGVPIGSLRFQFDGESCLFFLNFSSFLAGIYCE
jgi:Ubiquitin-2 like Rad60 SUMO-like